jgi:hypothetical protein
MKIVKVIVMSACALLLVVSCGKLDVVGTDSVRAFAALLEVVPAQADDMNGGWFLGAPDGQAKFVLSGNFAESPIHDIMLVFDAAPFIAAGLDVEKLPAGIDYIEGKIMLGAKLGDDKDVFTTPIVAYQYIVSNYRKTIGYHGALDHYGVNLGGGNLFEWAKDMSTNDKDMVFVLNPEPFLAAGVDPLKIEGWAFAKVTVDDENGKPIVVDKILKPFNLR